MNSKIWRYHSCPDMAVNFYFTNFNRRAAYAKRQKYKRVLRVASGRTFYSTFTLGRISLDKSLHMWLKTLLATLFNGSDMR